MSASLIKFAYKGKIRVKEVMDHAPKGNKFGAITKSKIYPAFLTRFSTFVSRFFFYRPSKFAAKCIPNFVTLHNKLILLDT